MHDTEEAERNAVQTSGEALVSARASLAKAERAAASAGPLDPSTEDAAKEWVMTDLAERSHTDAIDAQVAGARRRERRAKIGARPGVDGPVPSGSALAGRETEGALATSEETRIATLAFVADPVAHSDDEDMHPARLDLPSAELERALSKDRLDQRIADRDARDA